MVHVFPETELHPDQTPNTDDPSGVAVSTTVAPLAKLAVQLAVDPVVQLRFAPMALVELTVPPPAPLSTTVTGYVIGSNVAVMLVAAFIGTVQVVLVGAQTPLDQPVNTYFVAS